VGDGALDCRPLMLIARSFRVVDWKFNLLDDSHQLLTYLAP